MLEIVKAKAEDIDAIHLIHENCIEELSELNEPNAETYLDKRSRSTIYEILLKKESILIKWNGVPCGYFLFVRDHAGLLSKGIVIEKVAQGLGIQKLVHKIVSKKHKVFYVVSKYNYRSLKNILELGLKPIKDINENDTLYG